MPDEQWVIGQTTDDAELFVKAIEAQTPPGLVFKRKPVEPTFDYDPATDTRSEEEKKAQPIPPERLAAGPPTNASKLQPVSDLVADFEFPERDVINKRREEMGAVDAISTASDLLAALTTPEIQPYWIRIPNRQPVKVMIRSVSMVEYYAIEKETQFQKSGPKAVAAEAKGAATWIVAGVVHPDTGKPLFEKKDAAELLRSHPGAGTDLSLAIRRLSGQLETVRWDDVSSQLVLETSAKISEMLKAGLFDVLEERVDDPALFQALAPAKTMLMDQIQGVLGQMVAEAEIAGEVKFCHSVLGVNESAEDLKNG